MPKFEVRVPVLLPPSSLRQFAQTFALGVDPRFEEFGRLEVSLEVADNVEGGYIGRLVDGYSR